MRGSFQTCMPTETCPSDGDGREQRSHPAARIICRAMTPASASCSRSGISLNDSGSNATSNCSVVMNVQVAPVPRRIRPGADQSTSKRPADQAAADPFPKDVLQPVARLDFAGRWRPGQQHRACADGERAATHSVSIDPARHQAPWNGRRDLNSRLSLRQGIALTPALRPISGERTLGKQELAFCRAGR